MFGGLIGYIFNVFDLVLDVFWFDFVFVYGDIIIIFGVMFVVYYWCILVGYVEVGLCIGNLYLLWLEEVNCWVIGVFVLYYFVLIEMLCVNLLVEGVEVGWVYVIGNMVIDVLLMII